MKHLLAALAAAVICAGSPAFSQSLPLNTGYDYANFSLYAQPASGNSTVSDNYWIKIASYEPGTSPVAVAPAWVLPASPFPSWASPLTVAMGTGTIGSRWIGPRPVAASSPGVNAQNPAYSLFRKCFCLMPGYQNPQLTLQVRADDRVQVWLNTITSTLVGPANGNQNGTALTGTANPQQFQSGRNCVYVLVEDTFGLNMGFNLAGRVSATSGLMPAAGAGTDVSFAPCQCTAGGLPNAATTPRGGASRADDDAAVIQAILRIAETRRTGRPAGNAGGEWGRVSTRLAEGALGAARLRADWSASLSATR